jgi:transaldolase
MQYETYFDWLAAETETAWWHDSANSDELSLALQQHAVGVTTNPLLTAVAMHGQPAHWHDRAAQLPAGLQGEERAEALMQIVAGETAARLRPVFEASGQQMGYVCAQVNPNRAGDRAGMLAQARRLHAWAPNISVKLPATSAGLDVLEECTAEGMSTTATVSFTVPQVLAADAAYARGAARCRAAGRPVPRCFPVIMAGRLDDYLREVAQDQQAELSDADLRQAAVASVKRAYQILTRQGSQVTLIVAALRGVHHVTALAGARLVLSVHPTVQNKLLEPGVPCVLGIDQPVPADVLARLQRLPEFVRAYEPDGMRPAEFVTYGVTQRTLCQFVEAGWKPLEALRVQ